MTLNFSTPGCCCCWGSRRPVAAKSRRPRGRSKAAAEQRLQLGVYGNPELAAGSKELAPEGRGAVKILHAGLLLQGLPPASTRRTGGYGSAVLPPLTGKLRPKPENIGPMALRSKEPAPEERGVVKFSTSGCCCWGCLGPAAAKSRRL